MKHRILTTALRDGDLRPKERVLLMVQSDVAKERTGSAILSETDKHAIGEGWRPANNEEVREYNRYLEGANLMGGAEIDAQTTYLGATNSLLRASRIIDMALSKEGERVLDFCKQFTKEDTESGEAPLDLVLQNSGLELECVIHQYAFENLSEDLKKDVLALYPDAKTEGQYFDQEEAIADAFDGKKTLTKEAKEKLADAIVTSLHNKHAGLFKKFGADNGLQDEYFWSGYYAELPALEILSRWAFYNNQIPTKAEDLLHHIPEDKAYASESEEVADLFDAIRKELIPKLANYAEKHKKDIGEMLKETLLKWLDEGLFTKDFTPLWNSSGKETCNGVDTKLPHKEVFKEWLQAKRTSEQMILELIDTGELQIEDRVETIKRFKNEEDAFTRPLKLITGESLYHLTGDYSFAADYKKQTDDFAGLGGLIIFLRGRGFLKDYAIMLEFLELFKRLSKIYEIDVTYKLTPWFEVFKSDIQLLNSEVLIVAEKLQHASYDKHGIAFLIEILVEDMLIDLTKVQSNRGGSARYFTEFEKEFGSEFGSYEVSSSEVEEENP